VDDLHEIKSSYIEDGVKGFKEFFKEELVILEKNYQKVEVKWGVVSWCS
jgi:hypothetical protein